MRRAFLVAFVVCCACTRAATPTPSPAPRATATPTSTPERSNVRFVDVSVATVWTLPTSPRPIDAVALGNPAEPRAWLAHLTNAQKLDLVGRVQTQALYGTRVLVTESNGAWSHIVIPDQPSQKDPRGYPGWVPSVQLTAYAPQAGPTVWISSPTANVGGKELSYGTRLEEVSRNDKEVVVRMLGGRTATVPSSDVSAAPARDVLAEARKFIGLPYVWGGTSGFGFDCSGFTMLVYRAAGIALARDTDQQIHNGRSVALRDVAPGDLLFVADASGAVVHEAIYAGSGNIIESPRTGVGVRVVPLSTHRYIAARRVLPS